MKRNWLVAQACALIIAAAAHGAESQHGFSIAEQPLATALVELSTQADIAIFAPADLVKQLRSRGITGNMTAEEALTRLLAGTRLVFKRNGDGSYVVARQPAPGRDTSKAEAPLAGDEPAEVLVTAQKRAESAQNVPISMAVLGSAELQTKGITDLGGVMATTSSFTITPYPSSNNTLNVFMRGQGNRNPAVLNSEGGVGIYVDGFFIARSNAQTFDLADIERVEVLRGPQGTLYGKNTTGGAINVLTRAPTGEFGLRESLDYGNRSRYRTLTTLDLPAWNDVAAKVSLLKGGVDGDVENDGSSNDFGLERQSGARLQLRWSPAANFYADYAGDVGEIDSTPTYVQRPALNGRRFTIDGTTYTYFADDGPMDRTYRPMDLPLSNANFSGHGVTLSWKPNDALSVRSLSGYRKMKSEAFQNYNEVFGTVNHLTHDIYDQEQFSQELQLVGDALGGTVNYVSGLYFFTERGNEANFTPFDAQNTRSRSKSYAAYAQATMRPERFAERLDITVGARVTRDERTGANILMSPTGNITSRANGSLTFDSFDPALTVAWHWTDDVSTYAKAATAYRSGGLYFGHASEYRNDFAPERLLSYEIGLKSQWLERRLLLNLAAYAGTLKDMQFTFQLVTGQSASVLYNAGRAQINGVDFELEARPVDDLTMRLDYTFLDAQLKRVTGIAGSVFDPAVNPGCGCQLGDDVKDLFVVPRSPGHSGTFGTDYAFAHVGDGAVSAHLDFRWQSEFFSNGPDVLNRQYARFPSYGLVNGRIGYAGTVRGGSRFSASLWAKNLLDKAYRATLSGNGRQVPAATGPAALTDMSSWWAEPRSYGLSLGFQF